jgi:indolepyruvate ferredoxin oxidoreductase beta subunit
LKDSIHINNGKLNTQHPIPNTKILVAGVGGQGVVFLTNLLVKSALLADIPVATSEIHGLSQRGGSVTAGVTLGENTYGFIETAGVDILIGLEPLEAQRCVSFLHKNSIAIVDDNRILPYSVNSGNAPYPDIEKFINYLKNNIQTVLFNTKTPPSINSIQRNLYVLGRACSEIQFPIATKFIEKAINELSREGFEENSLAAFKQGLSNKETLVESKE